MNTISIISATNDKNLELSKDLQSILSEFNINTNLISLEDFDFPLYSPRVKVENKSIDALLKQLTSSKGLIFCSPEYNGGVPPVLSNALAWISVKSDNWRDVFNKKFAIIGSYSGGSGTRFVTAFRSQLEHCGVNVLARSITVNNQKPLDKESAKKIIQGLVDIVI